MTNVISKFMQAVPTYDQRASTVANVLMKNFFCQFVRVRIHSDQDQSFEGELIQLCELYGCYRASKTKDVQIYMQSFIPRHDQNRQWSTMTGMTQAR